MALGYCNCILGTAERHIGFLALVGSLQNSEGWLTTLTNIIQEYTQGVFCLGIVRLSFDLCGTNHRDLDFNDISGRDQVTI